jgi:hypothetical protein
LYRLATACPVCFSSEGASRETYVLTTIFLTLLPFVVIGTIIWWLSKRAKAHAADSELEQPAE